MTQHRWLLPVSRSQPVDARIKRPARANDRRLLALNGAIGSEAAHALKLDRPLVDCSREHHQPERGGSLLIRHRGRMTAPQLAIRLKDANRLGGKG